MHAINIVGASASKLCSAVEADQHEASIYVQSRWRVTESMQLKVCCVHMVAVVV